MGDLAFLLWISSETRTTPQHLNSYIPYLKEHQADVNLACVCVCWHIANLGYAVGMNNQET